MIHETHSYLRNEFFDEKLKLPFEVCLKGPWPVIIKRNAHMDSIFELSPPSIELLPGLGCIFSILHLLLVHVHIPITIMARLLILTAIALTGVLGWRVGKMVGARGT